ncbi:MAG: hypothetical protein ABL932_23305 [Terricaulis sp.]
MKTSTSLAIVAAMGAGLMAGNAAAQDMRDFDSLNSARASEGEAVRVRFSIPFQREEERRDTRVSFALQQGDGEGQMRSLDMFSFSLTGDAPPRLETPLALGVSEGDGFFSRPMNWVWIGLGVGVAYWVYDENQDDDDPAPQNNNN